MARKKNVDINPVSILSLPEFGSINFEEFEKEIRKRLSNNEIDIESAEFINTGLHIIIESLFEKYGKSVSYNKRKDGCSIWKMKSFECFLAIYLKDGSLIYSVRLNTVNVQNRLTCCYFSFKHMDADFYTLSTRVMRDFANLIHECRELTYAFESRDDAVPRKTYHSNGSWFCTEHEDSILRPRHYYEGYIDYSKSPEEYDYVPNDWDSWLDELGHVSKDKSADIDTLCYNFKKCVAQFKSNSHYFDMMISRYIPDADEDVGEE